MEAIVADADLSGPVDLLLSGRHAQQVIQGRKCPWPRHPEPADVPKPERVTPADPASKAVTPTCAPTFEPSSNRTCGSAGICPTPCIR